MLSVHLPLDWFVDCPSNTTFIQLPDRFVNGENMAKYARDWTTWSKHSHFHIVHVFIFRYSEHTHNTIDILNAHALTSLFSNWKPWLNLHMDQRPQSIYATDVHCIHEIIIQASFWQSFNNERGFCVHQLDCQCLTLLSTNERASTNLGIQLDIIVRFFEEKFLHFFWFFISVSYSLFPSVSKSKTFCHLFGSHFYMLINLFIIYISILAFTSHWW